MIRDLHEYEDGMVLEADVCVIGAGPAGIALSHEFAGTPYDVLLLESGGLTLDEDHRRLSDGESIGLPHRETSSGRARVFGGAGTLWAGQCLRMDAIDFTKRSWVPFSGWPFSAAELDPYYERAEAFYRIAGERYDSRVYKQFNMRGPDWNADALKALFTVYTPELNTGDAWKSRIERLPNVRLLLHANLCEIHTGDSRNAVESVRIGTLEGKRCTVRARAFVLCTGGIENARLLLASNRQIPCGLGNTKGHVGRYFQEHPGSFTATLGAGRVELLQQQLRMLYGNGGIKYFPKFRLAEELQRQEQVLNCAASLLFEYSEDSGIAALQELYRSVRKRKLPDRPGKVAGQILKNPGEVMHTLLERGLHHRSPSKTPERIRLQCYLEQAPNPESRILLSENRDRLGLPTVAVDWRLTNLEIRTLRTMTNAVRAEFARLGLGEVREEPWLTDEKGWQHHLTDCAHHCGTTRMAASASEGVVDPDCKVFGVEGLYVCGSSIFPTSGYANPTLTIVALSIRLADRLRKNLHAEISAAPAMARSAGATN